MRSRRSRIRPHSLRPSCTGRTSIISPSNFQICRHRTNCVWPELIHIRPLRWLRSSPSKNRRFRIKSIRRMHKRRHYNDSRMRLSCCRTSDRSARLRANLLTSWRSSSISLWIVLRRTWAFLPVISTNNSNRPNCRHRPQ